MTGPLSPPASVLFVCTGNICRSPAAELILREALAGAGVAVASAGTRALVGEPVAAPMAQLLAADGLPTDGFRARQLTEDQVRQAGLVIGLAREHRAAAVELVPAAVLRAFTLVELARLLGEVPTADLHALTVLEPWERLTAAGALARRHRSPVPPGADDVADPYGRSAAEYAASLALIRRALGPLIRLLSGRPSRPSTHPAGRA